MPPSHNGLYMHRLSTGYRLPRGGERIVSQELSGTIAPSELVMLMGPNGSGKSTLMHTIAGLLPALSGQVLVGGHDLTTLRSRARAQLLSLVLTERIATDNMTVLDVVRIGRYPYTGYLGKLSHSDEAIVHEAIDQCWLQGMEHRLLTELSDGERQRAMIARALAQETPLILLDEPTAHLDLSARLEVVLMLRRLARETGRSILVSTHELDLALSWGDTIWLMDRTGSLHMGVPEDVALSGMLELAFGNDRLTYSIERGEFAIRAEHTRLIALEGEGVSYLWASRALSRQGYRIEPYQGRHLPLVRAYADRWELTTPRGVWQAYSIGELLALLAQHT